MTMTKEQQKALDIYLESATLFNDFKPLSDREIAEALEDQGFKVGKSSIDRWRKKFDFEGHLRNKISASMVNDKETRELIEKSSSDEVIKKTIIDVERNGKLASKAYEILEHKSDLILSKYEATKQISDNDVKLALAIAQLTTGREDRMLDRAAMRDAAALVSRDDILAQLHVTDIEVEIE
jgi:hypothetical protein